MIYLNLRPVLASGCFDGIHLGHLRYLEAARELCHGGELFIVAVACDDYVVRAKGRRPRWTLDERIEALMRCGVADAVISHGPAGAADAIRFMRPRLFVKGRDWLRHMPADVSEACGEVGAVIELVDSGVAKHTSDALSTQ